jgi:purine-binding chemotaxis protein CheW
MLGETVTTPEVAAGAARLRAEFDAAFSRPPGAEAAETVELLTLRLGGDSFAVRLADTAGLFADQRITPVPGPLSDFHGLAGVRGALVPVYDLAALMGYPRSMQPRWLITARRSVVGFVFDTFLGQLRVETTSLAAHSAGISDEAGEVVRTPAFSGPVIQLNSIIHALSRRTARTVSQREA